MLSDNFKASQSKHFGHLMTHKGLENGLNVTHLTFSGGVAEGIYNENINPYSFGDIGIFLGRKIKKSELFENFTVLSPKETIRATVVGAGSHATKISGSTVYYDKELLPLKSLPVIKLSENISSEYKKKREWFDLSSPVAISIKGFSSPTYEQILSVAKELLKEIAEDDDVKLNDAMMKKILSVTSKM